MKHKIKDDFIIDLEEAIDKIRDTDEYLAFMVANMAAIVEHSDDAIIGVDNDGTILSWNNGAEKIYGYSPEEAIGKNISMLIHPDRSEELHFLLKKINADEVICNFETLRQRKDGAKIDVSITTSPIKDSKDIIVGASTIERDITLRKQAEKALKKSEEKYRRLFDDDLTGDFIATPEGKILECNPAFAEIYGFTDRDRVVGCEISQFNLVDWENLMKRLKTEHKVQGHQTTHKRPDGKQIHVVANVVSIFNKSNQLIQIKGYIFDDTERKKAEEALKKSEEKYRWLFDDDLTGDFIATLKGKVLECNPSFAEIYGFKNHKQAINSDISKFNSTDWENIVKGLKTERKIRGYQSWHRRPDGKQIHVVANVVGILNDSGELIQVKGYVFDDTERKEAEEALRESLASKSKILNALKKSEQKYRRLFDDDLTGDFIATPEGKILECNPAFSEIYGFKNREQAVKSDISKFNPSDWENLIKRFETEHKIKGYKTTYKRPDGKQIDVIANLVAIFDESRKLNGVKGYIFETE